MPQQFWLMQSEPEVFGLDTLAAQPAQTTAWDGVRNYQTRNMMRDQMKRADLAFFYHSNCAEPGTAGNPGSEHFDPKHSADNPRGYVVEVRLTRTIPLAEMKDGPVLAEMPLVRRGNRLSVMPVSAAAWQHILSQE